MTLHRRYVLALLAAGTLAPVFAAPVSALDPKSTAPINLDKSGLALRGYDPVNYFAAGKPLLEIAADFPGLNAAFGRERPVGLINGGEHLGGFLLHQPFDQGGLFLQRQGGNRFLNLGQLGHMAEP